MYVSGGGWKLGGGGVERNGENTVILWSGGFQLSESGWDAQTRQTAHDTFITSVIGKKITIAKKH